MTRPLPSILALAVLSSSSSPRLVASSFLQPPLTLRTVARCRSMPTSTAPFGFGLGSGAGAAATPSRPSLPPPFGMSSSSSSTDSSSAAADSSTEEGGTAAASTAPSNSTSSAPTPPSMLGKSSPLYGGDYAGLSATFSSSTGELIRVPEHLVPDSMIEWGQVPSCLEVLISEDFVLPGPGDHVDEGGDGDEDEGGGSTTTRFFLERKVAAVMPEVGCGVDNLDVMRTEETFEINTSPSSSVTTTFGTGIEAFALTRPLPSLRDAERIKIETAFSLPTPDDVEVEEEAAEGEKERASDTSYPRRVRVSFDVVPSKRTVSSPVTVVRERQTSVDSSGGTIGLGGGLDGRTVTRLVGKDNVNRPFAEGKGVTMDVAGSSRDGFTTLSLPGDVVVRIGARKEKEEGVGDDDGDEWTVDVGLVVSRQPGSEDDDDGDGRRTLGVVRWAFGAGGSDAAAWITDLISEKC